MPTYRGIEYKMYVKKDDETGGYYGQYTLTEHRGNEVIDYMSKYVILEGKNEPVKFKTEQEAKEASEHAAMQAIAHLID